MSVIQHMGKDLFPDYRHEYDIACYTWHKICNDSLFRYKIEGLSAPWPVPTWDGALDSVYYVKRDSISYRIASVDGSQIYPDRHQGYSCFLINIGTASFMYGAQSSVLLDNNPYLFTTKELSGFGEFSQDYVNAKRQELEMIDASRLAKFLCEDSSIPKLLLFDGSLIFWHLESKAQGLLEQFLPRYVTELHTLYSMAVPCAGYISLPRSRELVNLVRLQLCDFNVTNQEPWKLVDGIVDTTLVGSYLQSGFRTGIFKNNAAVSVRYPAHLSPYFFYLNTGYEIGRVEVPAWIAYDQERTDLVASLVIDQCTKGHGYPVAIAEAHEQAVVKAPDREFFYHMLNKVGFEYQIVQRSSLKSMRKKMMTI